MAENPEQVWLAVTGNGVELFALRTETVHSIEILQALQHHCNCAH